MYQNDGEDAGGYHDGRRRLATARGRRQKVGRSLHRVQGARGEPLDGGKREALLSPGMGARNRGNSSGSRAGFVPSQRLACALPALGRPKPAEYRLRSEHLGLHVVPCGVQARSDLSQRRAPRAEELLFSKGSGELASASASRTSGRRRSCHGGRRHPRGERTDGKRRSPCFLPPPAFPEAWHEWSTMRIDSGDFAPRSPRRRRRGAEQAVERPPRRDAWQGNRR